MSAAETEGGVPELLSLLLQQRDEQAVSEGDVESLADPGTAPSAEREELSEEETAALEDPEQQEAEDNAVREQLRDANEVRPTSAQAPTVFWCSKMV